MDSCRSSALSLITWKGLFSNNTQLVRQAKKMTICVEFTDIPRAVCQLVWSFMMEAFMITTSIFIYLFFLKSLSLTHTPPLTQPQPLPLPLSSSKNSPSTQLWPCSWPVLWPAAPIVAAILFQTSGWLLPTFIPGQAAAVPRVDTIARRHCRNADDAPPDPLRVSHSIPAHPRQGWQVYSETGGGECYHTLRQIIALG